MFGLMRMTISEDLIVLINMSNMLGITIYYNFFFNITNILLIF